jgi:hypothetical protein
MCVCMCVCMYVCVRVCAGNKKGRGRDEEKGVRMGGKTSVWDRRRKKGKRKRTDLGSAERPQLHLGPLDRHHLLLDKGETRQRWRGVCFIIISNYGES